MKHLYRYKTIISLDIPIEKVWEVLVDYQSWEKWWKVVHSMSIIKQEKSNHETKTLLFCSGGYIFHQLSLYGKVIENKHHHIINIFATGDLNATGQFILTSPQAGNTSIVLTWDAYLIKPWIKIASIFARSFFVYSHNLSMRWFAMGLKQHLQASTMTIQQENF